MVRRSVLLGALASLLRGGDCFRSRSNVVEDPADVLHGAEELADVPLTAEGFVELVKSGDLVADLTGVNFERSVATAELNVTGPIFTHMVASSAPISTACSWWQNNGINPFYKTFAHLCGVAGVGRQALDEHIERVWSLLKQAHASLNRVRTGGRTLKTFVSPEWTFRRYPINNADYVEPLSYDDVQYIVSSLSTRFAQNPVDWEDWLIVPGSIFWGVPYLQSSKDRFTGRVTKTTRYMVFNTLPVFHGGNFVYHHNKFAQADNINKVSEVWGYEVVQQFPASPGCAKYGGVADRVCGTTKFLEWLTQQHPSRPDFVEGVRVWGVKQPHAALIVNGLAVGVDICLDHRMTLGENARAAERLAKIGVQAFDLQFLVSSGMAFSIPEEDGALSLHVRDGGVGVSADGIGGPVESSHVFVKTQTGGAGGRWNSTKGVVHNQTYTVGGRAYTSAVKAMLAKDFTEQTPVIDRSWAGGCSGLASKRWCEMCSGQNQPMDAITRVFMDQRYQQDKDFLCETQAGNWQLLKLWATPIPLKPPQSTVVQKGWYKQTDKADFVTNVVAAR